MTHAPPRKDEGRALAGYAAPEDQSSTGANGSTRRMSVREMAREANVSVGAISLALKVQRECPELLPQVIAGKVTLSQALRSKLNEPGEDRYAAFVRAWNRLRDDERTRFLEEIEVW
jgi:hypothetical protein